MASKLTANLKVVAPSHDEESKSATYFTPIPEPIRKKLFYTPLPDSKIDRMSKRLSFLPTFKDYDHRKKKTEKLEKCEALARITLILIKYQKWIRKKKCIVQKWDNDSDSEEDSDEDEESDEEESDDEENEADQEAMPLAIFQQQAYGNNSMYEKIRKHQVYNWINKELSKNYNEGRLLKDYLHLLNEHQDEFEQIHNHLCEALDKQIKPDDDFKETYYCFSPENAFGVEIEIEKLLDEIQLHFGGIFDSEYFHQKYKVIKLIGTGIEGDVHKVQLRSQFESFKLLHELADADEDDDEGNASSSSSDDEEDEDDEKGRKQKHFYAAKTIEYNERTMNNYRVMGMWSILDEFEMYLDKKNDKLMLVSQLWDYDVFDFMQDEEKVFNEEELHVMMEYILPLIFKLHSNHYLHGDIKPSNFVMNVPANKSLLEAEYGLIDFGTMVSMNELTETTRSSLIGSVGYHAPELAFNQFDGPVKIDTKTDVWPLALTMIYLMQRTHPLIADDLNILGERKLSVKLEKYLDQMEKSRRISSDLKDLLKNMLQIDPIKRYNIYQIRNHHWITKQKTNQKRILFLDIDGVLNNKKSRPETIRPELLMKLKKIVNLTQCNIVLSSSWRRVPRLKQKFKKQFKKITRLDVSTVVIGDTPSNGKNPTRVHEIMEYFERNEATVGTPETCHWCTVDDMDMVNENPSFKTECEKFLDGHWVQPDIVTGITDENVEQIIAILSQ